MQQPSQHWRAVRTNAEEAGDCTSAWTMCRLQVTHELSQPRPLQRVQTLIVLTRVKCQSLTESDSD